MQRHPALAIPLDARHLRAAEATLDADLHALRPGPHRLHQRLLDGPPEGDPLLQLGGDVLRHQLGGELRLLDLLDRDPHALAGDLLQLIAQLVDTGPALANDDARLGGMQRNGQRRRGALGFDPGQAGVLEADHQHPPQAHVLEQERLVLLVRSEPLRLPVTVDAQPEPVRVNLVPHLLALFLLGVFLAVVLLFGFGLFGLSLLTLGRRL